MPTHAIVLTDAPDDAAKALVSGELDRFNEACTGLPHSTPLAVLVSEHTRGAVVGGLIGHTSLGLFFVDLFFLPDNLRSAGLGSSILRQAEAEAIRRGRRRAVLYAIAFQAPGFYLRHGYESCR